MGEVEYSKAWQVWDVILGCANLYGCLRLLLEPLRHVQYGRVVQSSYRGFRVDDLLQLISCCKGVMHNKEAKFSSYRSSCITSVCLYLSFIV